MEIPWAQSVLALPFLTVLAPSERYHQPRGRRHKTLTDWPVQMLKQVRRWLPERSLVIVGDSSFAVLALLHRTSQWANPVHWVSRLRLDAALYEPAVARQPHPMGRTRIKGKQLPKLNPILNDAQTVWQSLTLQRWYSNTERQVELCRGTAVWYHTGKPPVPIRWVLVRDPKGHTHLAATPAEILLWFRPRWQVEVTFEEVRAHLGVETQRQWSNLAILRTTPALFGLFSLVTLLAHYLYAQQPFDLPTTAWYTKSLPTCVDALAAVRRCLWTSRLFDWTSRLFERSHETPSSTKVPPELLELWSTLLCYAA
ncbi:transposase [Leptothermofonsia sp. ETS-13]|uniref:IS701 family transposase n=1 Tax=Leptothermofonsia sp. ETS-13 TaxID=3035696 RepID=UPI003BA19BDB